MIRDDERVQLGAVSITGARRWTKDELVGYYIELEG